MNKKIVLVGTSVMLICIVLSGCNEISNPLMDGDKTLSDGTKITGDLNHIEILNYTYGRYRRILYDGDMGDTGNWKNWGTTNEVIWNFDITDVASNLSKRELICKEYIEKGSIREGHLDWDEDYYGYYANFGGGEIIHLSIKNYRLSNNVSSWKIVGTAKNIGSAFLNYPKIIVNFYNENGAWLASESHIEDNIPSGYTWDFSITYRGEFRNDVDYMSFEVDA